MVLEVIFIVPLKPTLASIQISKEQLVNFAIKNF
jgi:hypothetical protein